MLYGFVHFRVPIVPTSMAGMVGIAGADDSLFTYDDEDLFPEDDESSFFADDDFFQGIVYVLSNSKPS